MDPALVELYEAGSHSDEVSVILRLADAGRPPDHVRIISRFGEIVTARMHRGSIPGVWDDDRVISIKAPRLMESPNAYEQAEQPADASEARSLLDLAEPLSARAPNVPEDGRGVVIGVCDWGVDFTHPNFRHADGTTRIRALWDQRGTGDPRAPQPFGYGRHHTRDQINAALATSDPLAALDYEFWSSDPGGTGTHGTHVLDILAGNRREPGSRSGIASGAEIVFVHLAAHHPRALENLGHSAGILEGFDFILRQAAGAPCVLHLSAGKTAGEHRGTSPLERAVDALLASNPGVVLVQSAGNYADAAMHTHGRIGPNQTTTLEWVIPQDDRTPNELEVWYSGEDAFDAILIAPDGAQSSVALGARTQIVRDGKLWGNFYHRRHEPNSGMNQIHVFMYTLAPGGRWSLVLRGREVVDGRFHAWIERDVGGRYQSRFSRKQATSGYTTNTICNSYRAIAVGAYDGARPDRPAASFSSRGPTADGRRKPEVSAPGFRIQAARSTPEGGYRAESRLCVKSGTSMAAPYVSGTVALMLQAAGRALTIHEIRGLLIGTADPLAPASDAEQLGYGYVNLEAAVNAARKLASEQPSALSSAPQAPPKPAQWVVAEAHAPRAEVGQQSAAQQSACSCAAESSEPELDASEPAWPLAFASDALDDADVDEFDAGLLPLHEVLGRQALSLDELDTLCRDES